MLGDKSRAAGAALTAWAFLAALCPGVSNATGNTPGFALQVSPTQLSIPQGAISTVQTFQIDNKGRTPFVVNVEKADFLTAEDGALRFQPDAPYAAASWATVSTRRLPVPAGATRKVTLRLTVPPDPEPGDHQFALIFKVPAGRNAENIKINRGIATPVLVTVPGAIDRSVRLAGLRAPGFAMRGPVPLTARIEDTGTVHRDFRGKDRLRVEVGGSTVRFPDFTVLRNSTRVVRATWDPPLMCVCHATVTLPGGERATVRIIVFPVHLLAIFLGCLAVAGTVTWVVRRRYRRRVVTEARRLAENGR